VEQLILQARVVAGWLKPEDILPPQSPDDQAPVENTEPTPSTAV
jgi:hypothetical protein